MRLAPLARHLLLLTLALAALPGCPRDLPPPTNAITDPLELRSAIDARQRKVSSARFKEVVLDYFGKAPDGSSQRIKVRQLILVDDHDRLLVQTRMPGGDDIVQRLVSDGRTFAMHNRQTNQYFTGKPTRANVNRLLPVDLSARDVVHVMLGGAPWDRMARDGGRGELKWDHRAGQYVLASKTATGGELELHVRPTDYAVVSLTERDKKGTLIYAYTTDDWQRMGAISLPRYRRFVWPARDLDFSLDVGETQLNAEFPDTLFSFPPPTGSQIIPLEDT